MLINGVDMNSRLTREPEAVCLLGPSDDTKIRIKTLDATICDPQIVIKPPFLLSHAYDFDVKRKAHCPVTRTQIKNFTASSEAQRVPMINAFPRPNFESMLIGFVKNSTFVGSACTDSFHFHHYDMTSLVLNVNWVQCPSVSQFIALHLSGIPEPIIYCSPVRYWIWSPDTKFQIPDSPPTVSQDLMMFQD